MSKHERSYKLSEPQMRVALYAMSDIVEENLQYLQSSEKRKWWPSDYFSFMQDDATYQESLTSLREEARGLSLASLVSLVGGEITEEALPNYASRLANLFPDKTGISDHPWNKWNRGWVAEEDTHGRVLDNYLLLTGRVNSGAVDRSIFSLLNSGFEQSPDLFQGIFYPMFQEVATQRSHLNVAKNAQKQGAERLYTISVNIAKDEQRHALFYRNVGRSLFDNYAHQAMISYYDLMKSGIVMPARLMTDGVYTKAPTLFDNYADVAILQGVYTPEDYAQIVDQLNMSMNIEHRNVTGDNEAEIAQEKVLTLPRRIKRIGERKLRDLANRERQPFEWIYGEKV